MADQADGLRRHRGHRPVRCIHVFSDTTDSATQLACALHRLGWTALLIDICGRPFFGSATRSLFDCQQQLARNQLHLLPMPFGHAWPAQGARADDPALMTVARDYDCLLFDACPEASDWTPLSGAAHSVVLQVKHQRASMLHGFSVLKTLSRLQDPARIGLLGDADACDHLLAACMRFLDPSFSRSVYSAAREDDVFATLAVRMIEEETSPPARFIKQK